MTPIQTAMIYLGWVAVGVGIVVIVSLIVMIAWLEWSSRKARRQPRAPWWEESQ